MRCRNIDNSLQSHQFARFVWGSGYNRLRFRPVCARSRKSGGWMIRKVNA